MNEQILSIQTQGILSPLIVRPLEGSTDEYEIVAGHRRFRAAQNAGLAEVPAFIIALDRDTAAIAVVDSNLHREHILPSEKSMFSGTVYCADCGKVLGYHTNTKNKSIHYFSCSNYVKDTRGECQKRHYIRADSLEQVVILELRRMAEMLRADEARFADILAQKTNRDILNEKKTAEAELQRAITRNETVMKLYEKLYEDNASGKVTDEWFMSLSHKYEVERMELKQKITELRKRLDDMGNCQQGREAFLNAIRKFMEMGTLTAPLLHELIDHIVVHETEGSGKSRTQRIEIFYRFVGYIVIPDDYFCGNYVTNTRQGVAVEYLPA